MPLYAIDGVAPQTPAADRYWIAPNATVIGNVAIGDEVGIWFGVVIRGDNERITIGPRTNVQENCIFHTDYGFPLTIEEDCTIGHGVILHGCAIGAGSLIGMGATLLNGAKIGRNCLVGAGALVTEGKAFEDGSLIVGSPAKAVRTLDADAIARLKLSAALYVQNWRRFAAGFAPA